MKNRFWIALSLAALLTVSAVAQQNSPTSSNQAQTQAAPPSQQTPDEKAADQSTSARQPLTLEKHEGFWGKINPFARKKYVQRQLEPVTNRVNELDELTSQNAKAIKDVDSRATEGIRMASAKANEADQHAVDAGNRAQAAQQTATQATNRLQTVETVVNNIDQYKPVTQTEIRFRPGQTVLSKKAKDALDQMATGLKDQRGYILEIQGFSAGRGVTAIESSQRMADAVRRYLVINSDVPVYRVHVLGLGNLPTTDADGKTQRVRGARVEVSLLKNDLEQLSSAEPIATGSSSTQGGMSGAATSSPAQQNSQPAAQQPPSSNMNAPATSKPAGQTQTPPPPPQQ
jgi:outer membrane protein OmpA-like peptidoglycan-associated protein